MHFTSEDGSGSYTIDLSNLDVHPNIREELAAGVEVATGPLGSWKRVASAKNAKYQAAQPITRWIAASRPELTSLTALTAADGLMIARSITDPRKLGPLRTLLAACPDVSSSVLDGFSRHSRPAKTLSARQPYSDDEFDRICTAARGIVRQARERITKHRKLVKDYRAGNLDHLPIDDPRRRLGRVLDHCDRHGDFPRSRVTGQSNVDVRRTSKGSGRGSGGPMLLLHLSPREAWAFGVLLTALTGFNLSVLDTLPAKSLIATGPGDPLVALIDTNKPRRGRRSRMTLPLVNDSDSKQRSSLSTPFGVYSLLIELSEDARRLTGSDRAFIYLAGRRFKPGVPFHAGQAAKWTAPWKTGDAAIDAALATVSTDRLRKTRLARTRTPIGQNRTTHNWYLQRMDSVRSEGFSIIAEALDEQVERALKRRAISVETDESGSDPSKDTVLGECSDFDRSPIDGTTCRESFLNCLDCLNARAFPRHLATQLAVADRLSESRSRVSAEEWARRCAGRLAQLEEIFAEYTSAQIAQARYEIGEHHRRLADQLLTGVLDSE